jgi:TM2 domain-containing membrane protein YozV
MSMPSPSSVPAPQPAFRPPGPDAPPKFDVFAAVLSYLIPGFGQIYQGRVGKGLLFCLSLYVLFFYGMFLGHWSNVFLGDTASRFPAWKLPALLNNLYNRPHFAGQFWMGIVCWPAIYHYNADPPNQPRGPIDNREDFIKKFQAAPDESELNALQRDGDKRWDLGWVYTVIAGVLNVLVIYDALAGPAFGPNDRKDELPA